MDYQLIAHFLNATNPQPFAGNYLGGGCFARVHSVRDHPALVLKTARFYAKAQDPNYRQHDGWLAYALWTLPRRDAMPALPRVYALSIFRNGYAALVECLPYPADFYEATAAPGFATAIAEARAALGDCFRWDIGHNVRRRADTSDAALGYVANDPLSYPSIAYPWAEAIERARAEAPLVPIAYSPEITMEPG